MEIGEPARLEGRRGAAPLREVGGEDVPGRIRRLVGKRHHVGGGGDRGRAVDAFPGSQVHETAAVSGQPEETPGGAFGLGDVDERAVPGPAEDPRAAVFRLREPHPLAAHDRHDVHVAEPDRLGPVAGRAERDRLAVGRDPRRTLDPVAAVEQAHVPVPQVDDRKVAGTAVRVDPGVVLMAEDDAVAARPVPARDVEVTPGETPVLAVRVVTVAHQGRVEVAVLEVLIHQFDVAFLLLPGLLLLGLGVGHQVADTPAVGGKAERPRPVLRVGDLVGLAAGERQQPHLLVFLSLPKEPEVTPIRRERRRGRRVLTGRVGDRVAPRRRDHVDPGPVLGLLALHERLRDREGHQRPVRGDRDRADPVVLHGERRRPAVVLGESEGRCGDGSQQRQQSYGNGGTSEHGGPPRRPGQRRSRQLPSIPPGRYASRVRAGLSSTQPRRRRSRSQTSARRATVRIRITSFSCSRT